MCTQNQKKFSTLFLDRDGVINHKIEGYIQSFSDFHFIDGIKESICKLHHLFDRMIIVTNQQGIGKKLMSIADLDSVHAEMILEIESSGGKIDNIYYCPHLSSVNCDCRKPKIGMFLQARRDFKDIDFHKSILLGDSDSDIQAAESIGIKAIKVSLEYTLADWVKDFIH